jgi:hypothetical protein
LRRLQVRLKIFAFHHLHFTITTTKLTLPICLRLPFLYYTILQPLTGDKMAWTFDLVLTRPSLAKGSIRRVTSPGLDKLQLQRLEQGSGAVGKWPILGVMVKDPVSGQSADAVTRGWLAGWLAGWPGCLALQHDMTWNCK